MVDSMEDPEVEEIAEKVAAISLADTPLKRITPIYITKPKPESGLSTLVNAGHLVTGNRFLFESFSSGFIIGGSAIAC